MLDSSLPTLLVTTAAATYSFGTSGPSTSGGNTWLLTGETPMPMLDSSLPALLVTGTAGQTHDPFSTMFALLETPLRMSQKKQQSICSRRKLFLFAAFHLIDELIMAINNKIGMPRMIFRDLLIRFSMIGKWIRRMQIVLHRPWPFCCTSLSFQINDPFSYSPPSTKNYTVAIFMFVKPISNDFRILQFTMGRFFRVCQLYLTVDFNQKSEATHLFLSTLSDDAGFTCCDLPVLSRKCWMKNLAIRKVCLI